MYRAAREGGHASHHWTSSERIVSQLLCRVAEVFSSGVGGRRRVSGSRGTTPRRSWPRSCDGMISDNWFTEHWWLTLLKSLLPHRQPSTPRVYSNEIHHCSEEAAALSSTFSSWICTSCHLGCRPEATMYRLSPTSVTITSCAKGPYPSLSPLVDKGVRSIRHAHPRVMSFSSENGNYKQI